MIPAGIWSSEIIVKGIAQQDQRAVMGMVCRFCAECPGFGKEVRDIIQCTDIGVSYDMMPVIVVITILKGIIIEPEPCNNEND